MHASVKSMLWKTIVTNCIQVIQPFLQPITTCVQDNIWHLPAGCQSIKVKVRCSKFECRKDIHFETQPELVAKNATPRLNSQNVYVSRYLRDEIILANANNLQLKGRSTA